MSECECDGERGFVAALTLCVCVAVCVVYAQGSARVFKWPVYGTYLCK